MESYLSALNMLFQLVDTLLPGLDSNTYAYVDEFWRHQHEQFWDIISTELVKVKLALAGVPDRQAWGLEHLARLSGIRWVLKDEQLMADHREKVRDAVLETINELHDSLIE